jgi:hypothetical protein
MVPFSPFVRGGHFLLTPLFRVWLAANRDIE